MVKRWQGRSGKDGRVLGEGGNKGLPSQCERQKEEGEKKTTNKGVLLSLRLLVLV